MLHCMCVLICKQSKKAEISRNFLQLRPQDPEKSTRHIMQDKNHWRLIVQFKYTVAQYEIICHHQYQLNKVELEHIIVELLQLWISQIEPIFSKNISFRIYEDDRPCFTIKWLDGMELTQVLRLITDFEPIPPMNNHLPYKIEFKSDFDYDFAVKSQHQMVFKTEWEPCPFMVQHKRPCNHLKNKNVKFTGKKNVQKIILKHLLSYDHFKHFGKEKPMCPYNNNGECVHFQNVLNDKNNEKDNFDEYFEDYRHLYLYFHKPNRSEQRYNTQGSGFEFECLGLHEQQKPILGRNLDHDLLLLIHEVITNKFENDLLPRIETNENDNALNDDIIKVINRCTGDPIEFCLKFQYNMISQDYISVRKRLKQKYKIFDILDEKMNHERHKKYGKPLFEYCMLALILYCNGDCNHSLCQSQRDGTFKTKWPCFNAALDRAIYILGNYEVHDENLYTGLAGVFWDTNQLYTNGLAGFGIRFKTNVSFSRDLKVAREFRGNEGLILGINIHRASIDIMGKTLNGYACDVSWISKYPTEQEVLVSKRHRLPICVSKSRQIGKKQWIVCNKGDDYKISFENMFLANNNVLN